mmetsp:Transcript_1853/g.6574  ORF Transcript_1853/g.6574 Transcript_1853/m.6574 type:complete len:797 (-) Transcript_1853:3052-5442(-)|eukprot:CAMPEP_0117438990 /NCGR_PEP_ID=MMETSP0759-20121206/2339_1 /TAXON_ID=63605 /ORGANISM="Percolomonas cosmopolitus, Strain WS" /LENGTH=796 /DNA_ID=CAMNT_0005230701 /DNA_START=132 /DNA_END=2522 /DNA_ORIENTATION=+
MTIPPQVSSPLGSHFDPLLSSRPKRSSNLSYVASKTRRPILGELNSDNAHSNASTVEVVNSNATNVSVTPENESNAQLDDYCETTTNHSSSNDSMSSSNIMPEGGEFQQQPDIEHDIHEPIMHRRKPPQPINSGIANRHKKNRLFNPPREIEPSVTVYQSLLVKMQQYASDSDGTQNDYNSQGSSPGSSSSDVLSTMPLLTQSLAKMLQDAILYYTKTKRIKIISNYELYHTVGRGAFSKVKFGLNTKGVPRQHSSSSDSTDSPGRLAKSEQQQWMMPPTKSAQRDQDPLPNTPLPTPIACKIISIDSMHAKEMQSYVMREIAIMRRLNHPNVVKFVDVVKSENNIYLFVELISAGDLMTRIKSRGKLSEATSRRFFVQLIQGLEYCHKTENIAHRDLKPQNILVDETPEGDVLKISDFGLAALVNDNKKKLMSQVGTVAFMSPEVRLGMSYNGFAADVYSCGMILYTMLCGQVLRLTDQEVKDAFTEKELKIDFPAHFSSEVKHLLSIMLDPDPKNRIELSEIRYHPWSISEFKAIEQKQKAKATLERESVNSTGSLPTATSPNERGGSSTLRTRTGVDRDDHSSDGSPLRKLNRKSTKPTLRLSSSTPKGLYALHRQRSNSDDSTGSRPVTSDAQVTGMRKRTLSLSKITTTPTMRRKKTASSPLTEKTNTADSKNTAASTTVAKNSKSLTFYLRKKKIQESIILVETVLQKMKCFVRADDPTELNVLFRYTDSFEKRVTLKYAIQFSIYKLGEGTQCTRVEFKHLTGELFAFRKNFKQVRKELSARNLTIDSR